MPAERIGMRDAREIIRLKSSSVSTHEIARRLGLARSTVTGTGAPPRLWRPAERDSHFDLLMRGALIPCIRPGMMPTLISASR